MDPNSMRSRLGYLLQRTPSFMDDDVDGWLHQAETQKLTALGELPLMHVLGPLAIRQRLWVTLVWF